MDGIAVTNLRTAAVSALAVRHLAVPDGRAAASRPRRAGARARRGAAGRRPRARRHAAARRATSGMTWSPQPASSAAARTAREPLDDGGRGRRPRNGGRHRLARRPTRARSTTRCGARAGDVGDRLGAARGRRCHPGDQPARSIHSTWRTLVRAGATRARTGARRPAPASRAPAWRGRTPDGRRHPHLTQAVVVAYESGLVAPRTGEADYSPSPRSGVRSSGSASSISLVKMRSERL